MLQEIMENADLTNFDYFGVKPLDEEWAIEHFEVRGKSMVKIHFDNGKGAMCCTNYHSLADLLANPSFCKCLWSVDGLVGEVCGKPEPRNGCGDWDCNREIWLEGYETHSPNAFQILQQQGDKECLTYIKSTQL